MPQYIHDEGWASMKGILERIETEHESGHAMLLEMICRHTHDCIVLLDNHFNFIRVNHAFARVCGREIPDFQGRNYFDCYPSPIIEDFEKVAKTGIPFNTYSCPLAFEQESARYWDMSLIPILEQGETSFLLFTLKDVSDRRCAEYALHRANRSLRMSSACNGLLVHAVDEADLFKGMCRAIVEEGDYLCARISLAERSGEENLVAEYRKGASSFSWRVTLPLGCCGMPYGELTVHGAEAFDEEETELLGRLAGDISYGIWGQRLREAQRQVEEKLRQSEERYRLILENGADAVMIVDPNGRFVYANRQAQTMLGYRAEELSKMGLPDIAADEEIENVLRLFETLKADGHVRCEIIKKHADGTLFPVEVNAVKLPDGNYFGACRDISERRRSDAALADSEKKYRMLFENSRDALMQNSPSDWGFSSVNRSALQLFGARSEQELMSLAPWDISPNFQPDGIASVEKAKRNLAITMKKGHHLFEWLHKRLDGTLFH
ncbi:MAG TPA: PAS domain S-box protein, partial [Burkholderiales bacterium]|nr:PAS domain S-box protein [Burkholderiales bacterium]